MLAKALFVLVVAGIGSNEETGTVKLSMTVLYESRCPDSRSFVRRQLQPAMKMLHDRITLKLVPFGKAHSVDGGLGGFECQHGPSECQGNIVQDCTLSLMSHRNDLDKTAYVTCEMDTFAAAIGSLTCVQLANVSTDAVNECLTSGRGTLLQFESERITKKYKPQFIPTVIINGVFNQVIQDMSQVDLIGTLCAVLMRSGDVFCSQYYNNFALTNVLG